MPAPTHIALTGNIASGKSTVTRLLSDKGATIIDADVLAREAVAPGSAGLSKVIEHFGRSFLKPDGTLDRAALGQHVFRNALERDALNRIVHPIVGRLRDQRLREATERGDRIVISDIPLLFEVGLDTAFPFLILVDASEDVRRRRLVENRHIDEAAAQAMIDAQMPSADKRSRSTWVIDNNGTLEDLKAQVDRLWTEIEAIPARRQR